MASDLASANWVSGSGAGDGPGMAPIDGVSDQAA
jgi:hypothetical protein